MFIKLTIFPHNGLLKLNINQIVGFRKNLTETIIWTSEQRQGEYWAVKESPEQIQELIDEQLLKMDKLSKSA